MIPATWSISDCGVVRATEPEAPPNKRLKLTGVDRLKGSGVLCPWRSRDFVPHPCAGEWVARSLSAIR